MTIEDPPWKKRTRPCPFYSQGRCLFADSCNFMHSVKIRRPDSVVGSEDSDQPDYRIVVDSPTAGRAVRFKSPPRSPRTMSLLMALGDVIQKDEEEGEWEEEESGEQESCSGEGSSEGRPSAEYAHPPAAEGREESEEHQAPMLFPSGDPENTVRPAPVIGLNEEARQLLTKVPSPEDDTRELVESSWAGDGTTLMDIFSPQSASPNREVPMLDDEETTIRLRREIIPEFPQPPNHVPSPRRDSISSGLLSPIEITSLPPISLPRHAPITREESFDSGYADGPAPLCLSPPARSPRRVSTLSLLSSPFGSPSSRVLRADPGAAPAAALFSPRFGAFPTNLEQASQGSAHQGEDSRHSRSDSVDSLDTSEDVGSDGEERVNRPIFDVSIEGDPPSPSPARTRQSDVPEGSSLFRAVHSPVYPPVDEASLRPGEPSFGEDDTMSSLYDQYYTPTTHSFRLQPPAAQETSPATLVGSEPPRNEPIPEAGPSSPRPQARPSPARQVSSPHPDLFAEHSSPVAHSSPRWSPYPHSRSSGTLSVTSQGQAVASSSSLLEAPRSESYPWSELPRVFSPPLILETANGAAIVSQSRSPSVHDVAEAAQSMAEDRAIHAPAEGSVRSTSSMSSRTEDSQRGLPSRKVPFGFRHSVSEHSQPSARSSRASLTLRIPPRPRPPPLTDIGRAEKSDHAVVTPLSAVEPPSAASSTSQGRLKPLRLSMILSSSSSLGSSIPSATHPPSLTTATTATTGAFSEWLVANLETQLCMQHIRHLHRLYHQSIRYLIIDCYRRHVLAPYLALAIPSDLRSVTLFRKLFLLPRVRSQPPHPSHARLHGSNASLSAGHSLCSLPDASPTSLSSMLARKAGSPNP
ncbi:hypothetical protein PYCCODRAFT_10295 [Trametes coccinea BRFM310]|uniref:C3H1-type domain-containing protein n=1 Tax=Trametes coccinea (strain BRFM310) TaxID=1353009 RepID=A0A1Y2J4L2_TRAC3|nr:hypothetical protein PYCCODRAFT_10295 [Trametes coccinea BRFM310]